MKSLSIWSTTFDKIIEASFIFPFFKLVASALSAAQNNTRYSFLGQLQVRHQLELVLTVRHCVQEVALHVFTNNFTGPLLRARPLVSALPGALIRSLLRKERRSQLTRHVDYESLML